MIKVLQSGVAVDEDGSDLADLDGRLKVYYSLLFSANISAIKS